MTKNAKESQIKGELQLVLMNQTTNFNCEKYDRFETDRSEKDKFVKSL